MLNEATPDDWYYATQGGGKAAYDELGQLYFREAPDWAPERAGTIVPDEWGIVGPFHISDGHAITVEEAAKAT
jgi:hypothetical protein